MARDLHCRPSSCQGRQSVGRRLLLVVALCLVSLVSGAVAEVERTLALVKPDAVRLGNASDIKRDIWAAGFEIVEERETLLPAGFWERFYAEHAGQHFYEDLVDFMSSGPILALVLEKQNAAAAWRAMMGPTNSAVARTMSPDSIRAKYGTDGRQNAVHGSESADCAREEIRMVFEEYRGEKNGYIANLVAGTSAVIAGAYGLRLLVMSWPTFMRSRKES